MKTMKHTTKANHKPLSLNDLGGGIGFAVTSSFTYRYRIEPSAGVRQGIGGRLLRFIHIIEI